MSISIDQIQSAITKSAPISFKTFKLNQATYTKLEQILEIILKELGEERIQSQISYCLHEIAENAKKANLKRVYFEEKGLSITNYQDYTEGMKNFKQDVFSNIERYHDLLEKKAFYTKISFHANSHTFILSISNNSQIMGFELKRIEERKTKAKAYKTMEEAFAQVLDSSEGAGLGIVIMILMLRKIGLNDDSFQIKPHNGITEVKIVVPRSDILLENLDPMVKKIVNEVETLPTFPEHIIKLKKLVNNPDENFSTIANYVSMDPGLTAEILKVVNSAQYMLQRKVDKLTEAITLIGFQGLKNLLFSYGSQKILKNKYGQMKSLWNHCYKTAFYGFRIAKRFHYKEIYDDIFVACLLHDLGKIVVEFLHPDLLENIRQFSTERGFTAKLFEKFTIGLHHAEIGAKLAEYWSFPEPLISAIHYHHEPCESKSSNTKLVKVVYIANSLCNIEEKSLIFEQMDPTVLSEFKIEDIATFESFHKSLIEEYEKEAIAVS